MYNQIMSNLYVALSLDRVRALSVLLEVFGQISPEIKLEFNSDSIIINHALIKAKVLEFDRYECTKPYSYIIDYHLWSQKLRLARKILENLDYKFFIIEKEEDELVTYFI